MDSFCDLDRCLLQRRLQFWGVRASSSRPWGNQSGALQSVMPHHPAIEVISGKQFPLEIGGKTLPMYNDSQEARVIEEKGTVPTPPNEKIQRQEWATNRTDQLVYEVKVVGCCGGDCRQLRFAGQSLESRLQ